MFSQHHVTETSLLLVCNGYFYHSQLFCMCQRLVNDTVWLLCKIRSEYLPLRVLLSWFLLSSFSNFVKLVEVNIMNAILMYNYHKHALLLGIVGASFILPQ